MIKNKTSLAEAINNVTAEIQTLEQQKQNLLRQIDSQYSVSLKKKEQDVAKNLIPLINAFERKGSRLVFPNGTRVRFTKIRFQFVEKLKEVNASWGNYLFHADTTYFGAVIYFSFKKIYPLDDRYSTVSYTNVKHYNFSPYHLKSIYGVQELLNECSDQELFFISLYGRPENVKNIEKKKQCEVLAEKIKKMFLLNKTLKQALYFQRINDDLIQVADNFNDLKSEDVNVLNRIIARSNEIKGFS